MKRFIKPYLDKLPYIRDLRQQINRQGAFPAGHYYSPIPDIGEISAYNTSKKPLQKELPGIHTNDEIQLRLLNQYSMYYDELPFPEKKSCHYRYYYENSFFTYSDAVFLYSFLRTHKPKNIIEIGSGFSSAIILDTVELFFTHRPEITFIEPNTTRLKQLLRNDDTKLAHIVEKNIQDVSPVLFSSLQAGDLLFIDSSHVVKYGSDLHTLFFEIMPHLPEGIFLHFHDIFYPFEYPSEWLTEGRYWNENYFLRAFLSYNSEWRIYFFNTYVAEVYNDFIAEKMPLCLKNSGGSLYIQRKRA